MSKIIRHLASLLFPGGLILLAAVGFLRPHGLPPWLHQPLGAFPYIVLGFGIVFGWYLASMRLLLTLLIFSLVERILMLPQTTGSEAPSSGEALFALSAFLLPLNLLALSLQKDGTLSVARTLIGLGFVLAQVVLVWWVCMPGQEAFLDAVRTPFLPGLATDWTRLPQPALVAFTLGVGLHLVRHALRREPLEAGSVWALTAIFLAYHGMAFGWQPSNFIAAAGLIMFVAFMQSTHRQTYQDELTGIAGRLAYEEATAQLGKRFTIAVIAIDQLKTYGSVHGKSVAEQVLRTVAPRVQTAIGTGRVFRVSGEELTVIFPNSAVTETIVALDAARKAVESLSIFLRGRDRVWVDLRGNSRPGKKDRPLPATLSIGVAECLGDSGTLSLAIKSAYRALYEAKGGGGNVVKRGSNAAEPPRRTAGAGGRIVATSEY